MKDLVERVALEIAVVMVERKRGTKVVIPPEETAKALAMANEEVGKEARAAIRAVLSHFSEPGNVTNEMCKEGSAGYIFGGWPAGVASAMRAALSELQAKEAGE